MAARKAEVSKFLEEYITSPEGMTMVRRRTIMNEYSRRDMLLRRMGFRSYKEYLLSELWATIRTAVFIFKGNTCVCCTRRASVIHHTSYAADVLLGETLEPLLPICHTCHRKVEFAPTGLKRSFKDANKFLRSLSKTRGSRRKAKPRKTRKRRTP